jgi:hypothetical protein
MTDAKQQKRNRGSTRFDPYSHLGTDAAFVSAREKYNGGSTNWHRRP